MKSRTGVAQGLVVVAPYIVSIESAYAVAPNLWGARSFDGALHAGLVLTGRALLGRAGQVVFFYLLLIWRTRQEAAR